MAYTSGASSVRRFCEGMPASPDAVSEKRNAGATWRGRRSRSCPAALECEEAASPTRSDAEDTHTLETHCSESTGSHNNAESCYYSETPVALPSLVDDRESSCSSMSACTPLLYPSNPSRLNASAPSFQPYVNAMQPQHQTLHQRVPAPPALLHRVPGSAYQHVPNHGHQGHPHSGHSNRYMGYEDTMQHSVSSSDSMYPHSAMSSSTQSHGMGDFSAPRPADDSFAAIAGNAVYYCATPDGARLLQRVFPTWSANDINCFFDEIAPHATSLMVDVTGSSVLQRLLEHSTEYVKKGMVKCLQGNVLELSLQPHSCRMTQRVLEVLDEDDCLTLALELETHVLRCVQDQHGSHVIQKLVDLLPTKAGFVLKALEGRIVDIATHSYGCRVVQHVLERCGGHEAIVVVLEEILARVDFLSLDQYGNYVVQHVIRNGHPQYQYAMVCKLGGHYARMCTHKFASNVVEKLLEYVQTSRPVILNELMEGISERDGVSDLARVATDPFGNYVAQRLLECSDDTNKANLSRHLSGYLSFLGRSHHAKNLQTRIKGFLAGETAVQTKRGRNAHHYNEREW